MIDNELGNGREDATDALQAEIDDMLAPASSVQHKVGGTLWLPSGIYRITRTLTIPDGMGFRMAGCGCAVRPPTKGILPQGGPWLSPVYPFLASVILYDGDAGEPAIQYNGMGGSFSDFSVWGQRKAGAGLRCHHHKGISSGHFHVGQLTVADCTIGVEFGSDIKDGNCADVSFSHLECFQCDVGFLVRNNFGMNFGLSWYQASHVNTAIQLDAGGKFHVGLLSTEQIDCVLRTGLQGSGNGSIVIEHLAADASNVKFPMLLDASATPAECTIKFGHVHFPAALRMKPRGEPIVNCLAARLIVDSGEYLPPDMPQQPNIILRNVLYNV